MAGDMATGASEPGSVRRLRRADPRGPGISRRRRGRGFEYRDARGNPIQDKQTLARIRALAIPPAWRDVWICTDERGHLQALGTDAAGRRQYRYHDRWRSRREREKHERMVLFANTLPEVRRRIEGDLALKGLPRERVLAASLRLLDRAFFRVGGESYAEQHGSYGLATIRKRHAHVRGDAITFDYIAKSGVRRIQRVGDPDLAKVLRALKRRSGGGYELLAWKQGDRWRDVKSPDINAYVKELAGNDFSAKDFRTWHATVLAAVVLAGKEGKATNATSRKRLVAAAVKDVAGFLGNTPAVCRASYVDPRVIDRFMDGETIGEDLADLDAIDLGKPAVQARLEAGVLELVEGARGRSPATRAA
jgi:DNA topoisomerase-1